MSRHVVDVRFEYPVVFTRDVFGTGAIDGGSVLVDVLRQKEPTRRHRVLVFVDSGVTASRPEYVSRIRAWAARHAAHVELAADPVVVTGGESSKNDRAVLEGILGRLHELALDRHSFVVALGGGALLDVVGYAAAITHRGLRLVRLPSTVLAQADSGVGVKNGVNAFGKKNFLGTFAAPFAVVCDTDLLASLEPRDRVSGLAEAVKVALVRDAELFGWLVARAPELARGDAAVLRTAVERSAMLHLRHIATSGDPFEMGSARPLDFGHWAAHKLESMTSHRLRHGEAVGIGLAVDALYSAAVGLCDHATAEATLSLLRALGFTLWDEALLAVAPDGRPVVLDGLAEFREHLGGELTVTMLERIGRGREIHEVDEPRMIECLRELARREARP